MPTSLPARKATPSSEHFGFKVALITSALVLLSFVAMTAELRFSSPGHSLSETEIAQNVTQE